MTTKNSAESRNELYERVSKYLSSLPETDDFTFMFKCRSNPSAAFAELHRNFLKAVEEDKQLANAFSKSVKNFKGVILTQKDAKILADLKKQHGDPRSEIKIGFLPSEIGLGLALMYDASLETLRSSGQPMSHIWDTRTIRFTEKSFSSFLPVIGAASVAAYELALDDKDFAHKLTLRGNELNTIMPLDNPPGPCEYCEFSYQQPDGTWQTNCGTKDDCNRFLGILILILIIIGIGKLIDWLF